MKDLFTGRHGYKVVQGLSCIITDGLKSHFLMVGVSFSCYVFSLCV